MPFIPGCDSDVFVSYARVDDQPLPPATRGWVSTFVEVLKVLLAQQLGRAELFTVWRDLGLTGNEPLTPAILSKVRSSATMLVVLSEGYLASEWCRREHNEFLASVGTGSRRLFVVERMPIEIARKPAELQELLGYPFWVRDRSDGPARTLGVPALSEGDREYYDRINRLANELAKELRRVNSSPRPTA